GDVEPHDAYVVAAVDERVVVLVTAAGRDVRTPWRVGDEGEVRPRPTAGGVLHQARVRARRHVDGGAAVVYGHVARRLPDGGPWVGSGPVARAVAARGRHVVVPCRRRHGAAGQRERLARRRHRDPHTGHG